MDDKRGARSWYMTSVCLPRGEYKVLETNKRAWQKLRSLRATDTCDFSASRQDRGVQSERKKAKHIFYSRLRHVGAR